MIQTDTFRFVKNDIENAIRRIINLKIVNVTIEYKTVEKALTVVADIISIAQKLFSIFRGLPPVPPDLGPGWDPI